MIVSETLHVISIVSVSLGFLSALIMAIDLIKHPQSMKIMNAVWILSGLWASVFALWAYYSFGREKSPMMDMKGMDMKGMDMKGMDMKGMDMKGMDMKGMDMKGMDMGHKNSHWQSIALSAMHCGAGCTLADIIGETFTIYNPLAIGGIALLGAWVFDYVLALIIGIYFQFYAIREMESISVFGGLWKAFKADVLSLSSWQVGMYGWMAIAIFVIFPGLDGDKGSWLFWFMMQVAMLFGFVCAYPMNALLIKLGIKHGM